MARTPNSPNFKFDLKVQRYRYTSGRKKGSFVGEKKVKAELGKYLAKQADITQKTNEKLFKGTLPLADWEEGLARRLKDAALIVFKIGNPALGNSPFDASDYGFIGAYLKATYAYLHGFSEKIKAGELSEAQINANMRLYFNDLTFLIEEGKRKSHIRNGWRWERRLLSIAEHCGSCVRYASLGWQPIGSLPSITTKCECQSNDKCYFEYSNSLIRPSLNSVGWIGSHITKEYYGNRAI